MTRLVIDNAFMFNSILESKNTDQLASVTFKYRPCWLKRVFLMNTRNVEIKDKNRLLGDLIQKERDKHIDTNGTAFEVDPNNDQGVTTDRCIQAIKNSANETDRNTAIRDYKQALPENASVEACEAIDQLLKIVKSDDINIEVYKYNPMKVVGTILLFIILVAIAIVAILLLLGVIIL